MRGKFSSREHSAALVGVSSRTIGQWVLDFETSTFIRESKRGRHSKTKTPINDEDFCAEFRSHVKENTRKKGVCTYLLFHMIRYKENNIYRK